ncbi:MAG: putative DNA binding domain-containing protein [Gemmatimonadaceae bacterium]|jgi:ATP-dependent DNA helicase RecG|nr:putative DNA binding domain-containing protein [Gemmatimonadaceae bacterium]
MSALELLESLNALDEHERIEAKRGSDTGRSLLETVCAFSNEPGLGGGSILLGVERDDLSLFPSYSAIGIAQPDKVSADIATQCREMFNVPVRVDVSTELVDGKPVIVVVVPEAPPHDKPIFFKNTGLPKGAFRRVGSTDQRCTDDDVALLYQGRERESYDSGIVVDASLEDISSEAIGEYRRAQAEFNADAEELRWTDLELLRSLGAVRRLADGEEWKPTVAGLIVFGTRQALRRCFPMTRVDYIRVPGKEWVPDPEKRFDTVELRDPLFKLIRRAQAAVLDDLPQSFGLEEGELQRTDTPIIPQRVIREALVNAVMHRSYRSHGPVQIIRYANRLEIRNPGFSLKSPEHLGEPGSQPRNPRIAAILHETRFAETKGSGIRVMREMMSAAGLTPPVFESDRGRDEFVARYLFHHFLGADDLAWLANFRDLHLSDEDAKSLIVVRETGTIDNASYRQLNRVDPLAASQALRRLRDAGALEQKGRGSATFYVPGPRLKGLTGNAVAPSEVEQDTPGMPVFGSFAPSLSGESQSLSGEFPSLSGEFPSLPRDLTPISGESTSQYSGQDLEQLAASERRSALLAPVPGDVAAMVGSLGSRSRPPQVKAVIKELLSLRPWQVDELSTVLRRNPAYIREQYLQPMVHDGVIEMTHPNEPNHPAQAYRIRGG